MNFILWGNNLKSPRESLDILSYLNDTCTVQVLYTTIATAYKLFAHIDHVYIVKKKKKRSDDYRSRIVLYDEYTVLTI